MDEVRADQQLRLAVGQRADGVGVPHFLEERFCHGDKRKIEKVGRDRWAHRERSGAPSGRALPRAI